jgi:HK97 family phage major capsid protein
MDPELKKLLDALRADLGKNVEAVARIDAIAKQAEQADANVKVLRAELDKVAARHDEREKTIKELQQAARVVRQEADPLRTRNESMSMLGMIIRQGLAAHMRSEVPAAFRHETDLVTAYRNDVLSRATLAFNAAPGSYLVPTMLETTPIDTLEEVSTLLGDVDYVPGLPMAGTINIPTITARPSLKPARASSDTKMTQSDAAFGTCAVSPKEAYVYFPVDNHFLNMAALPMGALLYRLLNEAVGEGIINWLLNADGTANYNSITGLLQETDAKYIYTLPAGKVTFNALGFDECVAAKKKVLQRGRARGKWLLAMDVEGAVASEDRTGKVPAITYGPDGTSRILRNPVVNDEGLPDLSTADQKSKIFGAFGDLATYLVGMAGGIQIASSSDYLFGNNQTAFRGVMLMDIIRKPVKTLVALKTPGA